MRIILVILLLLVLVAPVWSSTDIDTLADFMQEVRWIVHCSNDDMLPDSVLIGFSQRALLWTSSDIGGIEAIYRVITDTLQQFYAMPDTIVEILFATLLNGNVVHSMKVFDPAYFEDVFEITSLMQDDELAVPQAYNYWADSVQFLPTPIKRDTVYFKCYIEHPYVDDSADTVRLRSAYIEAALEWCCHLVYKRWQEPIPAAMHLAHYEALRQKLIGKYSRRIESPVPRQ